MIGGDSIQREYCSDPDKYVLTKGRFFFLFNYVIFFLMWHLIFEFLSYVSNFDYVANFSSGHISILLQFNVYVIQKITYSIVSDKNKIFNSWVTKKENLIYLDDYPSN